MIYLVVTIGRYCHLLRRFIRYYRRIGINNFLVIVNGSESYFFKVLKEFDIKPVCIWKEEFSEELKVKYERAIIDRYCSDNDWIVYADHDEFQYHTDIQDTIRKCEDKGKEYIYGRLIDRISETGELIKIDEKISLEKQFPLCSYITSKILKAWDRKIALAKKFLVVGGGHHVFLDKNNKSPLKYIKSTQFIEIHHFKWDYTFLERIKEYSMYTHDSLKYWREEMERFIKYYKINNRIDIKDAYKARVELGV